MERREHSTLWRISAFERLREVDTTSQMLPTTLMADLAQLERRGQGQDVLETLAACLRHREPALLYLGLDEHVWPITLFPAHWLVHARHEPAVLGPAEALARLRLLATERPGVRPPGHWMAERVADDAHYRPLRPLLWTLALHGPRAALLAEIGGRAAYRVTSAGATERPALSGALGPALQRLRQDAASLHDMQHWPGLSLERASRLLNALYLSGGLMVTRTHPAAREEPGARRAPGRRS